MGHGTVGREAPAATTHFAISARGVTTLCTLIAVASTITLVLVATIKSADALATVALALAIITFGAQLVQTIGQSLVGNSQFEHTVAVNTAAQEALAEIRFSTGEALARRDAHFERLLQSIVPSALAQTLIDRPDVADQVDIDALSKRLVDVALQQLDQGHTMEAGNSKTSSTGEASIDAVLADRPLAAREMRSYTASQQLRIWSKLATEASQIRSWSDEKLRDYIESLAGG